MCSLFKRDIIACTLQAISDLRHLADGAKNHEESVDHIEAC